MLAIDVARCRPPTRRAVTGLEIAAGPRCPSVMRANVPAAGGQILPDLPRAVCGRSGCLVPLATSYGYAASAAPTANTGTWIPDLPGLVSTSLDDMGGADDVSVLVTGATEIWNADGSMCGRLALSRSIPDDHQVLKFASRGR